MPIYTEGARRRGMHSPSVASSGSGRSRIAGRRRSRSRRLGLAAAAALALASPAAHARWGCPRFFSAFPQIESLALTGDRVVFARGSDVGVIDLPCEADLPRIDLSREDLVRMRPELEDQVMSPRFERESIEQRPVSCQRDGAFVYFGLAFYGGEGSVGVGGIGRMDLASKAVDVRRPHALRGVSIRKLLKSGDTIWLATEESTEGTRGPAVGLARYDWDEDRLETFQGSHEGPCGLWVNDLLLHGGELWVATELGLSRYSLGSRRWRHFVPVGHPAQELRETTCDRLYAEVAARLPDDPLASESACDLEGETPRDIFRKLLQERRPGSAAAIRWSDPSEPAGRSAE